MCLGFEGRNRPRWESCCLGSTNPQLHDAQACTRAQCLARRLGGIEEVDVAWWKWLGDGFLTLGIGVALEVG